MVDWPTPGAPYGAHADVRSVFFYLILRAPHLTPAHAQAWTTAGAPHEAHTHARSPGLSFLVTPHGGTKSLNSSAVKMWYPPPLLAPSYVQPVTCLVISRARRPVPSQGGKQHARAQNAYAVASVDWWAVLASTTQPLPL